jgi:hypothetical protein
MSKFVGFGCDGASNMMGCKTGLVSFLIASHSLIPTDIFSNDGAPRKVFHSEFFH